MCNRTLTTFVILGLVVGPVRAVEAFDEPYCGLHCIHAALTALGRKVDFNSLVTARNLSGHTGSTAADLVRIAEEHDVPSSYVVGLSLADLRKLTSPAILHTQIPVAKTGYFHWVLFLGLNGDQVRIFDPAGGEYESPVGELFSYWDGSAVLVGQQEMSSLAATLNLETLLASVLVVAGLVVGVAFRFNSRAPVFATLCVAAIAAILWHSICDIGFFHGGSGLSVVASRFQQYDVSATVFDEVFRSFEADDVAVIDARIVRDFEIGHIPGSHNIPITTTYGQLSAALAQVERDRRVIVYCMSRDCTWAQEIAQLIVARGYRRVSVYTEGWREWRSNRNAPIEIGESNARSISSPATVS